MESKLFIETLLTHQIIFGNLFMSGIRICEEETQILLAEFKTEKGQLNGPCHFYSRDGALMESAHMKNGLLHGEYITYYEKGQIQSKLTFKKGLREGDCVTYHPSGAIMKKELYRKGVLKLHLQNDVVMDDFVNNFRQTIIHL